MAVAIFCIGIISMHVSELLFHLTRRRGLYLLNDKYVTAVAFVEGFDQALDRRPLEGFHEWVCQRVLGRHTGMSWPYVVASVEVPEVLSGGCDLNALDSETQRRMIDRMLVLIEEFTGAVEVKVR
ncbi:hypothetical protein [Micromonospora sp. CA-111912]|uniref:hypothetical protein n=1 Tax=Micromonospora sp. CA-111912 TaxID=3239955 RepID=UPI003D90AFB2